MQNPNDGERRSYFEHLLLVQTTKPPTNKRKVGMYNIVQSLNMQIEQDF